MEQEKCPFYDFARNQRTREINAGLGTSGTQNYEKHGCFDCNGFDETCENYVQYLEFRREQIQ